MLDRPQTKKLVLGAGLLIAMGAFGASMSLAEQARTRTSASASTQSRSSSGKSAVQRGGGDRSRGGAASTRSGGSVDRRGSRGDGGRRHGRRGYRNHGYRIGLGYYGGWGGFYGGYGGYYYNPFYYGYPVYYSYHPERFRDFGALDLNIRPKKTEVWVDGQYVGTAGRFDGYPGHLWLGDGRHELIFFKQGFETVRREVNVLEGVVLDIDHRMVAGVSVPAEEITVFTPEKLGRLEQEQAYRSDRKPDDGRPSPGYRERDGRVERRSVREDARAEPGRVVLDIAPADASVYLDGRFLGSGRELARLHSGLMVAPGDHVLEIVRPGFDSEEVPFSVESGEETSLSVDLEEARV